MIEQHVNLTAHLQRTSETNSVPAAWALAELSRVIAKIPEASRDSATLIGWNGLRVDYTHRRTDLEVAQAKLAALMSTLRLAESGGLTPDQITEALKQAGG